MVRILTKNGVENTNIDGARDNNFNAGGRSGIVKGVLNEGLFTAQGSELVFDTCELRISGHRVVIEEPTRVRFSGIPSYAERFQYIAKITNTDGAISFELITTVIHELEQDDILNGNGVYEFEIGRFTHDTNGNITDVVRTADVITGGTGSGGDGGFVVGNVNTETLDAGLDAEVDVEQNTETGAVDFSFAIPQGKTGAAGVGISSVSKISTDGLVDTYTITLTNGKTYDFTVTNGAKGSDGTTFTPSVSQDGIISWTNDGGKANPSSVSIKGNTGVGIYNITKVSTVDLVDTYRIRLTDNSTYDFTVTNGAQGAQGIQGIQGKTALGFSGVITDSDLPVTDETLTFSDMSLFNRTPSINDIFIALAETADNKTGLVTLKVTNLTTQGVTTARVVSSVETSGASGKDGLDACVYKKTIQDAAPVIGTAVEITNVASGDFTRTPFVPYVDGSGVEHYDVFFATWKYSDSCGVAMLQPNYISDSGGIVQAKWVSFINTKGDTGAKGDKGDKGDDGVGISSIAKTGTVGLVDTYTITLTNGQTYDFTVTNGKDGTGGGGGTYVLDLSGELTVLASEARAAINAYKSGSVVLCRMVFDDGDSGTIDGLTGTLASVAFPDSGIVENTTLAFVVIVEETIMKFTLQVPDTAADTDELTFEQAEVGGFDRYFTPYLGTGKSAEVTYDSNVATVTVPLECSGVGSGYYKFKYITVPVMLLLFANGVEVGRGILPSFDSRWFSDADNAVLNTGTSFTVRTCPSKTGTESDQKTFRVTITVIQNDPGYFVFTVKVYSPYQTQYNLTTTASETERVTLNLGYVQGWY